MRWRPVRFRWWYVVVAVVGLLIVSLVVGVGMVVSKLGLKTSGFVVSQVYREVVHRDGSLQKFQKLRDNDSKGENKDNTMEVQGFILHTDLNQDIWLLTLYGIEHFTPLTDRKVGYYTLDECAKEAEILAHHQQYGWVYLYQDTYPSLLALNQASLGKFRPFAAISYLADDEGKSVKRYRHLHVADGLIHMTFGKDTLCPI